MEYFTITFNKYELNTLFRGLRLMEKRAERIDHILDYDFTKEFHTFAPGHLNEKGKQLWDENLAIKMDVGNLIRKLEQIRDDATKQKK